MCEHLNNVVRNNVCIWIKGGRRLTICTAWLCWDGAEHEGRVGNWNTESDQERDKINGNGTLIFRANSVLDANNVLHERLYKIRYTLKSDVSKSNIMCNQSATLHSWWISQHLSNIFSVTTFAFEENNGKILLPIPFTTLMTRSTRFSNRFHKLRQSRDHRLTTDKDLCFITTVVWVRYKLVANIC